MRRTPATTIQPRYPWKNSRLIWIGAGLLLVVILVVASVDGSKTTARQRAMDSAHHVYANAYQKTLELQRRPASSAVKSGTPQVRP